MSIIEHARAELMRANWDDGDSRAMVEILERFFAQWNSGGAVWVVAPVLQRLIAGQPLSPLTGEDDEWYRPVDSEPILQNKRCASVFKDPDGRAYDIDVKGEYGKSATITFPYWPDRAEVPSPVMEVREK